MEAEAQDLSRRDRNKLRNRKEILEAAMAVFAEKGYHQASIQEIADRADFAVSTIYALFENKEDLYRKVSVDVARRCGEMFDTAMARGRNEYEQLVNFAHAKGDALRHFSDGVRMLDNELHSNQTGDEPVQNVISEIYTRFLTRIEELFAKGIEHGLFAKGDPQLMAMSLDALTSTLLRQYQTEPNRFPYDERVDEVLAIFFGPVLIDEQAVKR